MKRLYYLSPMTKEQVWLLAEIENFTFLSNWHKELLFRYSKLKQRETEYPLGRCFAYAILKFNSRYTEERFSREVLNFYYYY